MTVAAVILGLLVGLFGQYGAFAMTGGGHGWIMPFFLSPLLWIAYPVVLARAVNVFWRGRAVPKVEWTMVALAPISDVLLVAMTYREGIEYFQRAFNILGWIAQLWIALWLGWQFLAVANLAKAKGWWFGERVTPILFEEA